MKVTTHLLILVSVLATASAQREEDLKRLLDLSRKTDAASAAFLGTPRDTQIKHAWLGINVTTIPSSTQQQLGLDPGIGLQVDYIAPKSPADKIGLLENDIITQLDDQRLINAHQLKILLLTYKPGEIIELHLVSGGEKKQVQIPLGARATSAVTSLSSAPPPMSLPPLPQLAAGKISPEKLLQMATAKSGAILLDKNHKNQTVTISDGSGSLEISTLNSNKQLLLKDTEGKVLYSGSADSDSIPSLAKEKLEMIENGKLSASGIQQLEKK